MAKNQLQAFMLNRGGSQWEGMAIEKNTSNTNFLSCLHKGHTMAFEVAV